MRVEAPLTVTAAPQQRQTSSLSPENRAGEAFTIPEGKSDPTVPPCATCEAPFPTEAPPSSALTRDRTVENSPKQVAAAYRQASALKKRGLLGDIAKYKDDQLLRNPGGDAYNLPMKTDEHDPAQQRSFVQSVGKDLSDAWGNCKRFFQNLAFGSELQYRDGSGQIHTTRQNGLMGTLGNFLKNTASGLSFGLWTPGEATSPSGFKQRILHFMKKTGEAFLGDLMQGVPASINRMGKNLVLAGWNLVEVLPDATLGQFDAGRKLTTTVFDNGQVVVEYLTDVIPSGEAWMRVHAASLSGFKLPILYNLSKPEHSTEDSRWESVRNTPFRKTIETLGALLADAVAIGFIGQTLSDGGKHERS